jgi:hypothetical protein
MVDTVVGAMGAPTLEATDAGVTDAGVTDAAMLVIMPEEGTDAATPVAVDTMAEAPSAVVVITAAAVAAASTAAAVDTVVAVDTGN